MKIKALLVIIAAVLMLAGCSNEVSNKQGDTPTTITEENKDNLATGTIKQPDLSNSSSDSRTSGASVKVKEYEDETHKEIQYGKLSFDIGLYHIVTHIYSDSSETFKCESDKGQVEPVAHMNITVQEIQKQSFLNSEGIMSYLRDMAPKYRKIRIYDNVTDKSGVASLYIVTEGGLTKYVVGYTDACYLLQSDNSNLDAFMFKSLTIEPNYEAYKQEVKCANSFTADVYETISYDDNNVEYELTQGKDGKKYFAHLSCDEERQWDFTLKNENGETLLTLSTYGDPNDVIKFLDVNMDGYADIQFLEQQGALNNSYSLYVWDDSAMNFIKVKCDEMLSYFDVEDGYLQNWLKDDADSGVSQKLVWEDMNTLIKVSEEKYTTD